jgi:hypothetical protein
VRTSEDGWMGHGSCGSQFMRWWLIGTGTYPDDCTPFLRQLCATTWHKGRKGGQADGMEWKRCGCGGWTPASRGKCGDQVGWTCASPTSSAAMINRVRSVDSTRYYAVGVVQCMRCDSSATQCKRQAKRRRARFGGGKSDDERRSGNQSPKHSSPFQWLGVRG